MQATRVITGDMHVRLANCKNMLNIDIGELD